MAKNNITLPVGVCIFVSIYFLPAELSEALFRGKNRLVNENIQNPLRPHRLHLKPLFRARLPQDCGNFKHGACLRPADRFWGVYREGGSFVIPDFRGVNPELTLHKPPKLEALYRVRYRLPTVRTLPACNRALPPYNCCPFRPRPLIPRLYQLPQDRV